MLQYPMEFIALFAAYAILTMGIFVLSIARWGAFGPLIVIGLVGLVYAVRACLFG